MAAGAAPGRPKGPNMLNSPAPVITPSASRASAPRRRPLTPMTATKPPKMTITALNAPASGRNAAETSEMACQPAFQEAWKAIGNPVIWLGTVNDPASLRGALQASQRDFAKLLSTYHPSRGPKRPIGKDTIATWEYAYRHAARPAVRAKYRLSNETLAAYRALIEDVIAVAGEGRYTVRARMGTKVWRFKVITTCRTCGRTYTPPTSRSVNCPRCCGRPTSAAPKTPGGRR